MSQTTLTSFYNSRKRPATDEIVNSKNKIAHIERPETFKKIGIKISKNSDVTVTEEQPEFKLQSIIIEKKSGEPKSVEASLSETKTKTLLAKKNNSANVAKNTNPLSREETTRLARKELNLGDIRKKLASSSRLAELRSTAERISLGIQQLHQSSEKKCLKDFKRLDVEVPISPSKKSLIQKELLSPKKNIVSSPIQQHHHLISPRKVIVSPVKSPTKVSAYIRHASLATSSSSLPLPYQYRFLAEIFRGMETVVALLYNRNEKITFTKLKPSIQEILKRNFTQKHLAQIKHLVPDFYNFEIQKVKNFTTSSQKEQHELVITPNLPNDLAVMNPTVLLERRRYFFDVLLQVTKKHHALFLQSLDPPMSIPDDKIIRWHPEFELEKVPDIECAKLPDLPNKEKLSTAQDVLAKARELFKCNTKMERALERLAEANKRGLTDKEKEVTKCMSSPSTSSATQTSGSSSGPATFLNPALKNLPAALLEKVKAKQAAKALEAMTRSAECDKKYMVYSRLPDLARTLRNIFVTERKNVLALNIVLSKLESSFKANISTNDLEKDIKTLAEEVPNWITHHTVRNVPYLKLDKNADLKIITSKLEALAEKYKLN